MSKDTQDSLADLAYFRALDAAKTLLEQVAYFRRKESPRREEMVEHAVNLLSMHMELVEQMRIDYRQRRKEREEQYAFKVVQN
jgi:hypothetical protein